MLLESKLLLQRLQVFIENEGSSAEMSPLVGLPLVGLLKK